MSLYAVAVALAGGALLQGCGDPTYTHKGTSEVAQHCESQIKFVVGNNKKCCDVISNAQDENEVDKLLDLYCVDDCASKNYEVQRASGDTCRNALMAKLDGTVDKASKLKVMFEMIFKGESQQIVGSDGDKDVPTGAAASNPTVATADMQAPAVTRTVAGSAPAVPTGLTINVAQPVPVVQPQAVPAAATQAVAVPVASVPAASVDPATNPVPPLAPAGATKSATAFAQTGSGGESALVQRAREARRVRK